MLRSAQNMFIACKPHKTSLREILNFSMTKSSVHTSAIRLRGHLSREVRPVMRELRERRLKIELNNQLKEENPILRRSAQSDWNYQAELAALNGRLGENIPLQMLVEVFTTEGHIEQEKQKQEELNIDIKLTAKSNDDLSATGRDLIDRTVTSWLRGALPALPEEGVLALQSFLTSEDLLSEVAFHIGCKDLIQAVEYPPLRSDFAKAFEALVGALARSDASRAETFIRELLIVQLVGKDLNELWEIKNPMRVLTRILKNQGRGEPESRLLHNCGPKTLLATFNVGVYSDKELVGEYFGETLEIAEEMAARDALRNFFKTNISHIVLPIHTKFEDSKPNPSTEDWNEKSLPNLIIN